MSKIDLVMCVVTYATLFGIFVRSLVPSTIQSLEYQVRRARMRRACLNMPFMALACALLLTACPPSLDEDGSVVIELGDVVVNNYYGDDDDSASEPEEEPTPEPEPELDELLGEVSFWLPEDPTLSGVSQYSPDAKDVYFGTWRFEVAGAQSLELRGWWPRVYVSEDPSSWYTLWFPGSFGGASAQAALEQCTLRDVAGTIIMGPVNPTSDGTLAFQNPILLQDGAGESLVLTLDVYCDVTPAWPLNANPDGYAVMWESGVEGIDLQADGQPVPVVSLSTNGTDMNPTRQIRVAPTSLLGVTLSPESPYGEASWVDGGVYAARFRFAAGHQLQIDAFRLIVATSTSLTWNSCGDITYGGGIDIYRILSNGEWQPITRSVSYVSVNGEPCWSDINAQLAWVDVEPEGEVIDSATWIEYAVTVSTVGTPAQGDGLAVGFSGLAEIVWTDLDTGIVHNGADGSITSYPWGNWITF